MVNIAERVHRIRRRRDYQRARHQASAARRPAGMLCSSSRRRA
ncbi:hypothetical protein [Stenotrophomonas acidaminiphila]